MHKNRNELQYPWSKQKARLHSMPQLFSHEKRIKCTYQGLHLGHQLVCLQLACGCGWLAKNQRQLPKAMPRYHWTPTLIRDPPQEKQTGPNPCSGLQARKFKSNMNNDNCCSTWHGWHHAVGGPVSVGKRDRQQKMANRGWRLRRHLAGKGVQPETVLHVGRDSYGLAGRHSIKSESKQASRGALRNQSG